MTLDFNATQFPYAAIDIIAIRMQLIDSSVTVLKRQLRGQDPNFSIGVFPKDWTPVLSSNEMLGVDYARSPTLENYTVTVQALVKDAVEETGLRNHSNLSEMVRTILGSDAPLRGQLGGLTVYFNGVGKRLKKWTVRSSKYYGNQIAGNNLYLTTTELTLEVEKI